jgi:hypothetical protein
MSQTAENWRIEARAFPIPYTVYVHQFWVLIRPGGEIVDQFHGMAVDRKNRCKTIGIPLHRIQVLSLPQSSLAAQPGQPQMICASGSAVSCQTRWQAARHAKDELNALGLRYWLFVQNSNTVFRTLGEIMNVQIPRLGYAPGLGGILSQEIVKRYRYLFL